MLAWWSHMYCRHSQMWLRFTLLIRAGFVVVDYAHLLVLWSTDLFCANYKQCIGARWCGSLTSY